MLASTRLRSDTAAAEARNITEMSAMNACSSSRDSFWLSRANGPRPRSVPAIAIPDRITTAVATSRWRKRNVAHASPGKHRNWTGRFLDPNTGMPPNTNSPVAMTYANISTASSSFRPLHLSRCRSAHSTRNGATTSAPAASPSHHVSQMPGACGPDASLPSSRQATPIVALTVVPMVPASNAYAKMSRGTSKQRRPCANRRTSPLATTASSVLPMPIPIEVAIPPAVVTFTRNAPSSTPGQTRWPKIKSEAIAIPVGGHTAEALAFTNARLSPILPAAK